jgi:GNAT superfamily N-acetyltransferase
LREIVIGGLVEYNNAMAGPSRAVPLAIGLRDANGAAVGGLIGRTVYDWLFVELLFVPAPLRKNGWGAKLMQLAETEAVARGCVGVWLDTFSFQARGFYERQGYEVFGTLEGMPQGEARYFMRKKLSGRG